MTILQFKILRTLYNYYPVFNIHPKILFENLHLKDKKNFDEALEVLIAQGYIVQDPKTGDIKISEPGVKSWEAETDLLVGILNEVLAIKEILKDIGEQIEKLGS